MLNFWGLRKKLAIIMACLLITVLLVGCGSSSTKKKSDVITIKAEEMVNDYIRDQGTAESKYKDKNVSITGKVLHKTQFSNTDHFLLRLAYNNVNGKAYYIDIDVPADKVEIVNKAEEGKFINVEGTCVGIVPQDDPTSVSVQIHANKINQ